MQNIVLDIDGTLVKLNPENVENLCHVLRKRCFPVLSFDGSQRQWIVERPYLQEFLSYCFRNFNVIVWSAGEMSYISQVVTQVFPKKPFLVFSRREIKYFQGFPIKPLSRLKERTGGIVNERNTIFVDDNYYTFLENPENGIVIPEYKILFNDDLDDFLLQLKVWLEENKDRVTDVRKLDKSCIFRFPGMWRKKYEEE